jgi:hypothetical protein
MLIDRKDRQSGENAPEGAPQRMAPLTGLARGYEIRTEFVQHPVYSRRTDPQGANELPG